MELSYRTESVKQFPVDTACPVLFLNIFFHLCQQASATQICLSLFASLFLSVCVFEFQLKTCKAIAFQQVLQGKALTTEYFYKIDASSFEVQMVTKSWFIWGICSKLISSATMFDLSHASAVQIECTASHLEHLFGFWFLSLPLGNKFTLASLCFFSFVLFFGCGQLIPGIVIVFFSHF